MNERGFGPANGVGSCTQRGGRPVGDAGGDGDSVAVLPLLQFGDRARAHSRPVAVVGGAGLCQRLLLRGPAAGPDPGRHRLRSHRPAPHGGHPVRIDDGRSAAARHRPVGRRACARPLRGRPRLRRQLHGRRRPDIALVSAPVVGHRAELAVRAEPVRPAAGRTAAGDRRRDGRLARHVRRHGRDCRAGRGAVPADRA